MGFHSVEAGKRGSYKTTAKLCMIFMLKSNIVDLVQVGKEREIRTQAAANASGVPFILVISDIKRILLDKIS